MSNDFALDCLACMCAYYRIYGQTPGKWTLWKQIMALQGTYGKIYDGWYVRDLLKELRFRRYLDHNNRLQRAAYEYIVSLPETEQLAVSTTVLRKPERAYNIFRGWEWDDESAVKKQKQA